jgi:hypothetical protein
MGRQFDAPFRCKTPSHEVLPSFGDLAILVPRGRWLIPALGGTGCASNLGLTPPWRKSDCRSFGRPRPVSPETIPAWDGQDWPPWGVGRRTVHCCGCSSPNDSEAHLRDLRMSSCPPAPVAITGRLSPYTLEGPVPLSGCVELVSPMISPRRLPLFGRYVDVPAGSVATASINCRYCLLELTVYVLLSTALQISAAPG